MPKKTYAKKRTTRRRFKKKRMYTSSKVMVNKMPKRVHCVLSPIFFTTMQAQCQAVLPIGSLATDTFSVYASKIYQPFNSPTPLSAVATGLGSVALNSLVPAGFVAMSNIYMSYRVHKCTMRITATPRASADQLLLCIYPQDEDTGAVASAQQALSAPYSKTITCTGNNNIKQNTMSIGVKNREYFGRTKQSYRSENDYAVIEGLNGSPLINMVYHVWYQTYSNAVTTAEIALNVVLTYSIEFFEPNTDLAI